MRQRTDSMTIILSTFFTCQRVLGDEYGAVERALGRRAKSVEF